MKKYYSLFLFWSLLTGLSTSCSDDNKKDPYLPTPPQVSIGNPSGQTTCLPGETIELKAILNNPLQTTRTGRPGSFFHCLGISLE